MCGGEMNGKSRMGNGTYNLLTEYGKSVAKISKYNYNKCMVLTENFGYQRGDEYGSNRKYAMLWFYYVNEVIDSGCQKLIGLDIVDNSNGVVRKDGIKDGICCCYYMTEGKLEKSEWSYEWKN